MNVYDVIVIGGGHAGCEAALVSGRMGRRTLMIVSCLDNIAHMPCNPSIGGPAKGTLVRELDALGGEQARAADSSTIHLRWLNTSKGPAVRALRAQCDLKTYAKHYLDALTSVENIYIYQSMATEICVEDGAIVGVVDRFGEKFASRRVVLAGGTYMRGVVHVGLNSFSSGPIGQVPSIALSDSLIKNGIELGRLRTDTTPRISRRSVDWDDIPHQYSDPEPESFSLWSEKRTYGGYFCGVTRTNTRTHEILLSSLDRSPLASRRLDAKGPRYCPSIDDKVMRFPDRETHPIFLEPVGKDSDEVYMQNFSTSMPPDVQIEMVHTLPGCKDARVLRPGYGIEYDYVYPTQLEPWLETKVIKGLYCAGQVNGTSGYEEAGAQGFIAGANAALASLGRDPLVLGRTSSYIGVLIDDITTKGTDEPYRMLPSRCEHRLILRHDNADDRLCDIGRVLGTIGDDEWRVVESRREALRSERSRLSGVRIKPSDEVNEVLRSLGSSEINESVSALDMLTRPEVHWKDIARFLDSRVDGEIGTKIEIELKYAGYVEREERRISHIASMDALPIPASLDFASISGLSAEAREKLSRIKPRTLGAASRVPGVTIADVQLVHVAMERARREREA